MTITQPAIADSSFEEFGPSVISHWTGTARLGQLGTYLQIYRTTGESDPWTLRYEESVFLIEGETWFVEITPDGERRVDAAVGSLTVLTPGTTVRYGGTAGTRVLMSIAPVNWAHGEA